MRQREHSAAAREGVRGSVWLLGGVLAMLPYCLTVGGATEPLAYLKWPLGAAGMVGCLALRLVENRRGGERAARSWTELGREPFFLGAAMIVTGLVLSAIFSPVPGLGWRVAGREIFFVLFAAALALGGAGSREVRLILFCLLGSMGVQALIALGQFFFPSIIRAVLPIGAAFGGQRGAMIGTFGNPEHLASWLAVGLGAGAALGWGALRRDRCDALGWLAGAVAMLSLAAINFSGGRGGFLAAAGALLLTAAAVKVSKIQSDRGNGDENRPSPAVKAEAGGEGRKRHRWAMAAGGAALILVLGIMLAAGRPGDLWGRLRQLTDLATPSMRHRTGLMIVTSRMILHDPLLGVGPGRYGCGFGETLARLARQEEGVGFWALADAMTGSYVGEAHSDPLQWWAEYGLLPFLGLTLMIAGALTSGWRGYREEGWGQSPARLALWTAVLTLSLNMWVSFPLHLPVRALTFWALLGLLMGAGQIEPAPSRPDHSKSIKIKR